jgi:D-alanine-D-alanine ligase
VKPANMGSSVGVSKVKTADELLPAIDAAFAHDEWVIVEEAISGRELECAVLGLLTPRASVVGEIVPKAEFYDYEDKYSGVGAELVIPADVPASVSDSLRALALQAFDVVRAEGLARVDFFYEEGGRGLLLNEVNTMPGFTPYSMYPQLWAATGLPYDELIDSLVSLAIERYDRRATRRRGLSAGS